MVLRYTPAPRLLVSITLAIVLAAVGVALFVSQGPGGVVHGAGEPTEQVLVDQDGNLTVVRTAPGVGTQGYGGYERLLIRVKDADGNPVISGRVEAFSSPDVRDFGGFLDDAGEVHADIADGTYVVTVSASNDNFFVVKEGVEAPGAVDIDPQGTVPVSILVLDLDQSPINATILLRPGGAAVGDVGNTNPSEEPLVASVTPRHYEAFLAWSWSDLYYLFVPDVNVDGPINLTLDSAQADSGTLTFADIPGFGGVFFFVWNQLYSPDISPQFEAEEGASVVLQSGTYYINLQLIIPGDGNFDRWNYEVDALPGTIDINTRFQHRRDGWRGLRR